MWRMSSGLGVVIFFLPASCSSISIRSHVRSIWMVEWQLKWSTSAVDVVTFLSLDKILSWFSLEPCTRCQPTVRRLRIKRWICYSKNLRSILEYSPKSLIRKIPPPTLGHLGPA
jgi:hypothetical protein